MRWQTTLTAFNRVLPSVLAAVVLSSVCQSASSEGKGSSIARATCGPGDRAETVQGQTTLAERFSPGPSAPYNCNLELVSQFEGEGTSADLEIFDQCVYYTTAFNPKMAHPGVAVVDVTNARQPRATAYLATPAMLFAHESLEVHPGRKLLIASRAPSTFDVYDISDCRHPMLKSSIALAGEFAGMFNHAGQFSADGMTFYGAKWPVGAEAQAAPPPATAIFALDMSDAGNPRGTAMWTPPDKQWIAHTVSVNREETRAYVGIQRLEDDEAKSAHPNGLVILDISDVRSRRSNPRMQLVASLFWDDAHLSSISLPAMIKGRPHVIFSDAMGAIGLKTPPPANVCDSGRPGHGFTRIIDISNERKPKTVSRLIIEVADPRNCSKVMHDPTIPGGYGSFGCSVDNQEDAKLLACGQHEAGLRVFDIRDPADPREVAYYKPRARRTEERSGSIWRTGAVNDLTADTVIIVPIFRNNSQEIWFTSSDNGFQIVRFTDSFRAAYKDLFSK